MDLPFLSAETYTSLVQALLFILLSPLNHHIYVHQRGKAMVMKTKTIEHKKITRFDPYQVTHNISIDLKLAQI